MNVPVATVADLVDLARHHHRAGRVAQAEAFYREVLRAEPGHTEAVVMLASLLLLGGRVVEATTLMRDDVRRKPTDGAAHLALASLLQAQGASDEAAAMLERAHALAPSSDACLRLGQLEKARGRLDVALGWLRKAVALAPSSGEARHDLGNLLIAVGRPGDALVQFDEALQREPQRAELHYGRGLALMAMGRVEPAADAYRRATMAAPAFAAAWNNLGGAAKALMRLDDAAAAFEQALRIDPAAPGPTGNLAGVYEWQARHDDAVALHRRAIALAPADAQAHGALLFTLLFHPRCDGEALRAEHDAWDRRHARPLAPGRPVQPRDRDAHRRLRVGYVCGAFRSHVLGRYLLPLLRAHDAAAVDLVCYSNNAGDDEVTDRFRAIAPTWRDIAALSDDAAAALVRDDRIDVLVDTTLHMDRNRLLLFARRPAPVQVTIAGYPGSTGMQAMDWRFTDPHLDPAGERDARYVEKSYRLPHTFWCYDPCGEDVPVGPLPAGTDGFVTFGSMNNFSKVNDGVLAAWAAVLQGVPGSRLLVLCHEGGHRERTLRVMTGLGIARTRIEFVGYRPRGRYLALFERIDIALDTFPYNGHTTSLDALWMGVPVVSLVGGTVVGRAGLSQLTNLGLPELIACTVADYVAIATALAGDRERLHELRRTLRLRMTRSPLMDAVAFARDVEAGFRAMWGGWCDANPA